MKIIICICTYKRNEQLIKLIKSIDAINYKDIKINKLIVDNFIESNCLNILYENNVRNFYYFIENKKGLSNARNRALSEVKKYDFDYCIFLDDDQIVAENWLEEMINSLKSNNSDIVKGNVIYFSNINKRERNTKVKLFYPDNNLKDGESIRYCGLGNTIMKKKVINEGVFFDSRFNYIGGEDTDFFLKLHNLGYKISYSERGIVYEEIGVDRLTTNYILKRNFIAGFSYLSVINDKSLKFKFKQVIKSICKLVASLILLVLFNILIKKYSVKYLKKVFQSFGEFCYLLDLNVKGIY